MTAEDVKRRLGVVRIGRSGLAELAGLSLFGLFLATISAYDSHEIRATERYLYWQLTVVGGGIIAALIEPWVARRLPGRPRLFVLAQLLAMTPLVALWVMIVPVLLFGRALEPDRALWVTPSVLTINVAVIALAWLARSALSPRRTPAAAPDAVAPLALRKRLAPRLARARLIAVEAEDHYLRVRTDAGSGLIHMRFADALEALAGSDGFRTHRSWWVARTAVEVARWKGGRGELVLSDGSTAPVSRTYAAALKGTDWAAPAS